jgi:hypothetical protein
MQRLRSEPWLIGEWMFHKSVFKAAYGLELPARSAGGGG